MTRPKTIPLGPLKLPLDAVTSVLAWIGNRGSGKSHGAAVAVEGALKAGAQVVVIDPTDAHYGLKYGRTKDKPGFPVYVLGGNHGDAPLEPGSGSLIGDVVVDSGRSFVLSLRRMSKTAQRSFVADFLERVYLRKGETNRPVPLLVVIDEAHKFAPEGAKADTARVLGAVQDVVLEGRGVGIGVWLITQRTAHISKSVLELAELLVAFRSTGVNGRKALKEWVTAHDVEDVAGEFFGAIASLPVGTAWAWSPGWLGVFEPVKIQKRETFDSSATPKAGARPLPKGKAAVVDLDALGVEMTEIRERQAANDPKKLKAELAAVQLRLVEAERRIDDLNAAPRPEPEGIPYVPMALLTRIRATEERLGPVFTDIVDTLGSLGGRVEVALTNVHGEIESCVEDMEKVATERPSPVTPVVWTEPAGSSRGSSGEARDQGTTPSGAGTTADVDAYVSGDVKLGQAETKVLTALIQFPGASKQKIGLLSGYSTKASTIPNALAELRRAGLVERGTTNPTAAGYATLPHVGPPPEGPALLDFWRQRVGAAERKVVDALVAWYPTEGSKVGLAKMTGYSPDASTIPNALAELRRAGIVERGRVILTREFAEAIQ